MVAGVGWLVNLLLVWVVVCSLFYLFWTYCLDLLVWWVAVGRLLLVASVWVRGWWLCCLVVCLFICVLWCVFGGGC